MQRQNQKLFTLFRLLGISALFYSILLPAPPVPTPAVTNVTDRRQLAERLSYSAGLNTSQSDINYRIADYLLERPAIDQQAVISRFAESGRRNIYLSLSEAKAIIDSMGATAEVASTTGEVVISTEARFKDFKCEWVESATVPATPVESISSVRLPATCSAGGTTGDFSLICSGTTMCHVNIVHGGVENATDLFFENTLCLAKGEKCTAATECVLQGGVFKENSAIMLFEGLKPATEKAKAFKAAKRAIQEPLAPKNSSEAH